MHASTRKWLGALGAGTLLTAALVWLLWEKHQSHPVPVATFAPVPAASMAPKIRAEPTKQPTPTSSVAAKVPAATGAAPIVATPVPPVSAPRNSPVASAEAPAAPVAQAPAQPAPDNASREIVASARMYWAHASLRALEEADPDSATNRKILTTMVAKSLAHAGGTAATTVTAKP